MSRVSSKEKKTMLSTVYGSRQSSNSENGQQSSSEYQIHKSLSNEDTTPVVDEKHVVPSRDGSSLRSQPSRKSSSSAQSDCGDDDKPVTDPVCPPKRKCDKKKKSKGGFLWILLIIFIIVMIIAVGYYMSRGGYGYDRGGSSNMIYAGVAFVVILLVMAPIFLSKSKH